MTGKRTAPCGTWRSPITADLIVSETIGLGATQVDGHDIYWTESRPTEGGRQVIVRRSADGRIGDLTPPGFNARTRVHEYGGGAYTVHKGTAYFSHFDDQRVYRQAPGQAPAPVTPAGDLCYADGIVDVARGRLIWVREDRGGAGAEPENCLVALNLAAAQEDPGTVLAAGHDFYASPRVSPDGTRLAWLSWDHPDMPWDGTELWVAGFQSDGSLGHAQLVAGGRNESIFQPEWGPDGNLVFCSDRSGWWNLYRRSESGIHCLCEMEAEFGLPQWVFGMSTYAFAEDGTIVCTYTRGGLWYLARLDPGTGRLTEVQCAYTTIGDLRAGPAGIVFCGGSARQDTTIVRFDLTSGRFEELRRASLLDVEPGFLSLPETIEFPTGEGLAAHALYYPPTNRDVQAPAGERPPLLVRSHGGPTAATNTTLKLVNQFWTSRGFGLVDVNYGGSTGYGRAYRERLNGSWGIVDVNDCVNAALYLVGRGEADPERLAIRGGSAGGYTTLAALTFRDTFKAGASHYGVGELESLVRETHKFEARYLDRLIGPYPPCQDLYRERSPIYHTERLSAPVIFFQGLEDAVVPPDQAQRMVAALKAKGLPVAYIPFPGEQHGFRQAANIKRALEAELYFYGKVFGFAPADCIEPVEILNL